MQTLTKYFVFSVIAAMIMIPGLSFCQDRYALSFDGEDGLVATYYSEMINIIETGGTISCMMFWDEEKYHNANFRVIKYLSAPPELVPSCLYAITPTIASSNIE